MKLSKDYVTLFDAAAKRGAIEELIIIFKALCNELNIVPEGQEDRPADEATAAAIAMLFNNRDTNQSGKKI